VIGGLRRSEVAVGEGSDQAGGDAYLYSLRDEEAYLQTDDDEKPDVMEGPPPPDPARFKCWFCRKTGKQVRTLYGAEFPVRDPNTFAIITLIFICNECVAKFADWDAMKAPGKPSSS